MKARLPTNQCTVPENTKLLQEEYSCIKLYYINFIACGCPIFHKIGNARILITLFSICHAVFNFIVFIRWYFLRKKQEYSCIKLFFINFVVCGCPIFIKLAKQGGWMALQIRCARDVCIHGETPLRLDNIGKKCRVPFIYTLCCFWFDCLNPKS